MIKAGHKGSAVNDVVWMGDVVNSAAHLCCHGSKRGPVMKKLLRYLTPGQPGFLGLEAVAVVVAVVGILIAYVVSRLTS
jgi:hypothetical protein